MGNDAVIQVGLPTPLRRLFDYRLPAGSGHSHYPIGSRVLVPFGRSQRVGLILGQQPASGDFQLRDAGPCLPRPFALVIPPS